MQPPHVFDPNVLTVTYGRQRTPTNNGIISSITTTTPPSPTDKLGWMSGYPTFWTRAQCHTPELLFLLTARASFVASRALFFSEMLTTACKQALALISLIDY